MTKMRKAHLARCLKSPSFGNTVLQQRSLYDTNPNQRTIFQKSRKIPHILPYSIKFDPSKMGTLTTYIRIFPKHLDGSAQPLFHSMPPKHLLGIPMNYQVIRWKMTLAGYVSRKNIDLTSMMYEFGYLRNVDLNFFISGYLWNRKHHTFFESLKKIKYLTTYICVNQCLSETNQVTLSHASSFTFPEAASQESDNGRRRFPHKEGFCWVNPINSPLKWNGNHTDSPGNKTSENVDQPKKRVTTWCWPRFEHVQIKLVRFSSGEVDWLTGGN